MIFPTIEFTLFYLIFLSFYFLLKNKGENYKIGLISLANIFFYAYLNPIMLAYLTGWTSIIYIADKINNKSNKYVFFVIIFGILQLFLWKYYDILPIEKHIQYIVTPIGLSFFTFQGLTYLFQRNNLDINIKEALPKWSFFKLFAFTSFFPTLFSGPIIRANDWQIELNKKINTIDIDKSMSLIILGLIYKLIFATYLGYFVKEVFSDPSGYDSLKLYLGALCYTFEIYTDFAGYSMMAIGIGLLMGFQLPTNFNQPYIALNIQDFWKRWHIALSSWLKDYLYIKLLGGNKYGFTRQLINAFLVMFFCGLWHGITLHYIVWGLFHAISIIIFIIINKYISKKLPKVVSVFITFHVVLLAWIWFRVEDYQSGLDYFKGLLTLNGVFHLNYIPIISLCLIVYLFHMYEKYILKNLSLISLKLNYVKCIYWSLLVVLVIIISPSGLPPFIYFSY